MIPSGDSIKVAFAILAGDDLTSIQASAAAAEVKYATINSIASLPTLVPGLHRNFPNPFKQSTKINYGVTENGNVLIEVYDVLGNKVSTLVSGIQNVGNILWNFQQII